MLTILILIPIIGSLIIMPMENSSQMKKFALNISIINFIVSLFVWYNFDSNTKQYQFVTSLNLNTGLSIPSLDFCHLNFGVDGISLYFLLLTTFISPIAILSNYTNIKENGHGNQVEQPIKLFLISLLLLESLQICAFVSLDLFLFYIFFESVLPILFILIIIFGHGMDRFRSAFLLFLYTLAGSLPMLLSILMIYNYIVSTDFQLISLCMETTKNFKNAFLKFLFS